MKKKSKKKQNWLVCCSNLNCRYRYQSKQLLNLQLQYINGALRQVGKRFQK